MQKTIFILILLISFSSCKSSKRAKNKKHTSTKVITKKAKETPTISTKTKKSKTSTAISKTTKTDKIIKHANQFKGVRYKWGGTTKSGMDCSGLVYESFRVNDIYLPRISRDMAKKGTKVSLKQVKKGDLLFFKTQNRRNAINHVGLVTDVKKGSITFIHATSSKGVITSVLTETYWNKAFAEARRLL
ncbi:MAG: C40 family peptidase [Algibacter sp.]